MRDRIGRRAVAAGAMLLAAAPLWAQTFFGEVAVDVVAVDVVVTDGGRPVYGLGADDFAVRVDGAPVAAELVVAPAPPGGVASDETAPARTEPATLVLVLDRTFSSQRFRMQALGWLEPFVREHVAGGGRVLVAAADPLVTILHRVDDPAEALWEVLEHERSVAGSGGSVWQEREYLLRTIERMSGSSQADLGPGGAASISGGAEEIESVIAEVRAYGERTAGLAATYLEAVSRFVDGLAGLDGRGVVVYVAEQLPVRPTEVLEEAIEHRLASLGGRAPMSAAAITSRRPEVDRALRLLERSAAAADLPFLLVDPAVARSLATVSAVQRGSSTRMSGAAADAGAAAQVTSALAAATGGRVLSANEGLPEQLARTQRELAQAYRLTFAPPHEPDVEEHRIDVRVERPGLRVVHREHYRLRSPTEKVTAAALAALQVGAVDERFGLEVETRPAVPAGEGVLQVPLLLRIPLDAVTLVPQGAEHRGELIVAVASGDGEGGLEGLHDQPLPLVIPNDELLTALGQDAGLAVQLGLRPGPHVLGIAVLDRVTGRIGSLRTEIEVAEETP